MKYKLRELLFEYKEINSNSKYEPVAVGRYGIRKRSEIYKKELSSDYSRNKVIRKDTLIIGLGSVQIDVGVLSGDSIYSVSPAYHTYNIKTSIVLPEYLELVFKANNLRWFSKYSVPTARQGKKVDLKCMLEEEVEIPNVDLQIKKINLIKRIKNVIDKANYEICLNNELIKSRFIELFGNPDLSVQKAEWSPLGSLTKIYTGTTPSTEDETLWNGKYSWVTPAELNEDSFYVYDTVRKLTEKGIKSKSLSVMPINTVLLSTRAPIGKVAIVGKPMACNQGFKNFLCGKKLNHVFLYTLLKFNGNYLNSIGSGTTFKEISKTKIKTVKIPVPDITKQNDFASFVEQVDKLKFNVKKRIELYQELLNKKMDEYFN